MTETQRPTTLSGPSHDPADGKAPQALVVLLHGVGADGNDLIGLAPYLATQLPFVRFVSPDAPFPYDMAPMGRQWFSLRDRRPAAITAGADEALSILNAYIDDERDRAGLDDSRVALLGFSQGAMMSLHAGLRREKPFAAIAAFSGRLIGPETIADSIRVRPPVLLLHGDDDPVVPYESTLEAGEALKAAGLDVSVMIRPGLGHGIDEAGIVAALRFFMVHLGQPAAEG